MLAHPAPSTDSAQVGGPLTSPAEIQKDERNRVRELLRYFQPDTTADRREQPRVSADPSLTAYAQLAAWKLNCQRSFISLVDHSNQYIIAEATRTVSLTTDTVYKGDDDAIFLGPMSLDLVFGMCAATIPTFISTDGSLNITAEYMKTDKTSFVINDMSKVDAYKDRPYVTGWPHMRYYAEVPISSPNGLCIGSICTVDDKPRDGLSQSNMASLQEIAATVMDHLDLVMSRVQRGRSQQMMAGIGVFAASGTTRVSLNSGTSFLEPHNFRKLNCETPWGEPLISSRSNSRAVTDRALQESHPNPSHITTASPAESQTLPETTIPEFGSAGKMMDIPSRQSAESPNTLQVDGIPSPNDNTTIHSRSQAVADSTFKHERPSSELADRMARAADLMREAMDLEGIVFFDQRVKQVELQISSNVDSAARAQSGATFKGPNHRQPAPKLTSSGINQESHNDFHASQGLLKLLVRKFPHGGILHFGPDGKCESYIEFEMVDKLSRGMRKVLQFSDTMTLDRTKPDGADLSDEVRELNRVLGARAMIVFPVKAASDEDIFAYAIGFTLMPTRVFQIEDLAYLTSFSNLLTIEVSRLDVVAADRAKSEFISSISHELRSPLHGILASVELLKDAIKDTTSADIFETIEACGSTLVDTLDSLLTFTKISSLTVNQQYMDKQSELAIGHPLIQESPQHLDHTVSSVDLASLVEDVMISSIAGHQARTSLEKKSSLHGQCLPYESTSAVAVNLICDIQTSINLQFSTQSGAWKRILMNLLGNALKYTPAGFIRVSLRCQEHHVQDLVEPQFLVYLTVEDTGLGISESFLANRLYKPFQQENNLQPGAGLGLSIVKQLVGNLNGQIEVASRVNKGTLVTVTVELKKAEDSLPLSPSTTARQELLGKLSGKIGLFGFNHFYNDKALPTELSIKDKQRRLALQETLTSSLRAFGLQSTLVSSAASQDVDALMMPEDAFRALDSAVLKARAKPLILLCTALKMDYRQATAEDVPIVYVSQPFGPKSLARALEDYLKFGKRDLQRNHVSSSLHLTHVDGTSAPDFLRPKALLVEDNPINMKLLVMFMEKLNLSYCTATDGQAAVDLYRAAGPFNIVLTDIQMPHKDGLVASAEIRLYERDARITRTYIVAITGLGLPETRAQAAESGIDRLLTKPVSFAAVKELIEAHFPSF